MTAARTPALPEGSAEASLRSSRRKRLAAPQNGGAYSSLSGTAALPALASSPFAIARPGEQGRRRGGDGGDPRRAPAPRWLPALALGRPRWGRRGEVVVVVEAARCTLGVVVLAGGQYGGLPLSMAGAVVPARLRGGGRGAAAPSWGLGSAGLRGAEPQGLLQTPINK